MSEDVISKIKERVDIVDLISSYLKLQKSGVNYKARCPFHNEKSGSFFVSPERQIWHCFGCGKGSDVFGFIKEIEGVEFPEALRTLAARAGVELQPYSPELQQLQSAKTKLYEISELAAKFFEKQLHESTIGRQALAYLTRRGLSAESVKNFRLGFAPDSWDSLTNFLEKKYLSQEIVSAGLAIKKDNGGYYDRFRSRIMFPVVDINGQVVGFSGRIYEQTGGNPAATDAGAKYVNTPQTAIYDKSRILYGLDRAKLAIRQKNKCLVVEGNVDVIMSHQAGAVNVVASSGTALTGGHLNIIKRYTDNLDLCFDSDEAGIMATERGVDLALARGFNVGIVAINEPEVKDPADFVQKHGASWAEYADKSQPFIEFFFENSKNKFDIATALGKKLLTQKVLPFVAALASNIEKAHWVSEISLALKVNEDVIRQELSQIKSRVNYDDESADVSAEISQQPNTSPGRLSMLEEGLISLLVKKPELAKNINPEVKKYLSANSQDLIGKIAEASEGEPGQAMSLLTTALSDPLKMSLEIIYLKSQELWRDFEDKQLVQELDNFLMQAKKQDITAKLEKLEYDIKSAERNKDKELLGTLVAEFSKISDELIKNYQ